MFLFLSFYRFMFLFLSNSFNLCTRLFDISKFNTLSGIGDYSEI